MALLAGGAEPRPASPAPVPGGGLEAHEKAGGHLLARHVGRSADELRQRLSSDPRISAASSFSDRTQAEVAVGECIQANQKRIQSWLRGGAARLVITHRSSSPVGITLARGNPRPRDALGTRLVLIRDGRFEGGWRILTGYPEP